MLKSLIVLPDGSELTSGTGQVNNIRSCTLTECVNSGEELTIGSACANMVEVTVQTPRGGLSLTAGDEVTLYKVDGAGTRHKVGLFTLEKPTRPSANLMKLTGYDRVAKLDKDLTGWLKGLTGWPYDLLTFAGMVCEACGLTLVTTDIPNGDYLVTQFSAEVTGRKLMQWIGEICCRFCRANADGEIELAWYTPAEVAIASSGANYYLQNGLSFESYQVAPIDAVQMRLADSEEGMLWPEAEEGANSYIISGNRLLNRVTEDMLPVLQVIQDELAGVTYTPCKVSIPATLDIHAGNTVQITDKNGVTITAYVMTKKQSGQRDSLECTGSPRRDSSTAMNNQDPSYIDASQAGAIAQGRMDAQTQEELFNKLTKDGAIQGLFMKDGQIYVNVAYLAAGVIASADGTVRIDLTNNKITASGKDTQGKPALATLQGSVLRIDRDDNNDGTYSLAFVLRAMAAGTELYSPEYLLLHGLEGTEVGNEESATLIKGLSILLNAPSVSLKGYEDGVKINGKTVSWKDNGDGTSTLIGT